MLLRKATTLFTKSSKPINFLSKSLRQAPRSFSTVAENTIHITFIDSQGNQARVPGMIGQNLLQVAQQNQVDVVGNCEGGVPSVVRRTENWTEDVFGEGPQCFYCHVHIPLKYHHLLPDFFDAEQEGLERAFREEVKNTSRLACQITLDRRHDGMIVYVPDAPQFPTTD